VLPSFAYSLFNQPLAALAGPAPKLIAARSWRTDSRLALAGHVDVPTLHAIILIDSGWRVSQAFNQEYQSSREWGVNLRKAESWDAAVLAAYPMRH